MGIDASLPSVMISIESSPIGIDRGRSSSFNKRRNASKSADMLDDPGALSVSSLANELPRASTRKPTREIVPFIV